MVGSALPAGRWLVWIVLLIFAVLLIAAGFQGRGGSLAAAIITPGNLKTSTDIANAASTIPKSQQVVAQ